MRKDNILFGKTFNETTIHETIHESLTIHQNNDNYHKTEQLLGKSGIIKSNEVK